MKISLVHHPHIERAQLVHHPHAPEIRLVHHPHIRNIRLAPFVRETMLSNFITANGTYIVTKNSTIFNAKQS